MGLLRRTPHVLGQAFGISGRPAHRPRRARSWRVPSGGFPRCDGQHRPPTYAGPCAGAVWMRSGAGRFDNWQREREIVAGWLGHLRAQGNSALGGLGVFLSFHWDAECQRQAVAISHLTAPMSSLGAVPVFQPWQQPKLSQAEGATSRSLMGPIGFILDLHAA
jgi:hypothetical protein